MGLGAVSKQLIGLPKIGLHRIKKVKSNNDNKIIK